MHTQIVLFDKFDPLDVIAPFEVLVAGAQAVGGDMTVELVSAEGGREVVSGTQDLTLTATGALDPTKPGYVIVPGASGPIAEDPDEGVETIPVLLAGVAETALIPLLHEAFENPDVVVATVCGGSALLAMAGMIENCYASTHYMGFDLLDAAGVNAVRARVVDDGKLISAGGVTSGLDLGLYLLERSYGPRVAHAVEELFEFERRGTVWKPSGREPLEW
ncbi:DJ-1/PfpI family protein [Mycolicibacter heraklionensis]|uniref:DJ-1/PfpI family protein n=1 Tax=Mycolicibacter heraklionensis TaxID=512402 RepID=UPI00061AC3A3|nr:MULTISPECIES: DJ-1/PfpI family protein [Mycobacteriaceae]OBG39846.1 glutamine amidotransferase [Mycolicibacter heraklionensis]OBJ29137.1 glutamine amidotransferase [Mycolicibacter heraklionensis]